MECLIVEDDEIIRMDYVEAMQDLGFTCLESATVSTASYLLKTHKFDVILLDLNVPDGQTLALVDYLSVTGSEALIILVTGTGAFPNGESTAIAPRVDFLLHKPVNLEDLCAIVSYACVTRSKAKTLT